MNRSNPSPRRGSSRQRGMALLEVLVAVLLFSLGILGLLGLQARAVTYSIDAEDRNRAALLANDVASIMWLTQSVNLDEAVLEAWQARVADAPVGGLVNGAGTVTPIAGTTSADILIEWQAPARGTSTTSPKSRLTTRVILP